MTTVSLERVKLAQLMVAVSGHNQYYWLCLCDVECWCDRGEGRNWWLMRNHLGVGSGHGVDGMGFGPLSVMMRYDRVGFGCGSGGGSSGGLDKGGVVRVGVMTIISLLVREFRGCPECGG